MNRSVENYSAVLLQAKQMYIDILTEYCRLWLKNELTEEEAARIESIYTKAEFDPLLDFFITKFDEILSEQAGLFSKESLQGYKNQQAWLREHLEQIPLEQYYLIEGQKFLKEVGLYAGPVDGIWGDRTSDAAMRYRKQVQTLLQEKGFYKGKIDGELGEKSVSAIQAFQRNFNLRNDGVPGRQTYAALNQCL